MGWFIFAVILGGMLFYQYKKQSNLKKLINALKDPEQYKKYIEIHKYTVKQQKEMCAEHGLDYYEVSSLIKKEEEMKKWAKKLTTVWAGDTSTIMFDYTDHNGKPSHRQINPEELVYDKDYNFFIKGICQDRQESRHFNVERISNLIADGLPTHFSQWCKQALDIIPSSLVPKNKKSNFSTVIWEGECPPTTFTYRDWESRNRITVKPICLLQHANGYFDLIAIDEHGKTKTYFKQYIETMLATEGFKKKHFDNWVNDVLEIIL